MQQSILIPPRQALFLYTPMSSLLSSLERPRPLSPRLALGHTLREKPFTYGGTPTMALRVPVTSTRKTAMTRERWWWSRLAGLLLLAGIIGGCGGDDHDGEPHAQSRCLVFGEREPNDTPPIA